MSHDMHRNNRCTLSTGVRAIRGPPKMGGPGPRNARDVGTGGPEIASVIGTWELVQGYM